MKIHMKHLHKNYNVPSCDIPRIKIQTNSLSHKRDDLKNGKIVMLMPIGLLYTTNYLQIVTITYSSHIFMTSFT